MKKRLKRFGRMAAAKAAQNRRQQAAYAKASGVKLGPKIEWNHQTLDKLPSAREVRDVLGYVKLDGYKIAHHDNWGDERFPWQVRAPNSGDPLDGGEVLDEFPTFREAVAFAKTRPLPPAPSAPHVFRRVAIVEPEESTPAPYTRDQFEEDTPQELLDVLGVKAAPAELSHLRRLANAMAPDPRDWEYLGEVYDSGAPTSACTSGHPIRYVFTIRTKDAKRSLPIGSVCIETSVPWLISNGAESLGVALTAAVKKLKEDIAAAERKKRDEANTGLLAQLHDDWQALDEWCSALRRSRVGFLPRVVWKGLGKPKQATSPGRTVASMKKKYATVYLASLEYLPTVSSSSTFPARPAAPPAPKRRELREACTKAIKYEFDWRKSWIDNRKVDGVVSKWDEERLERYGRDCSKYSAWMAQLHGTIFDRETPPDPCALGHE